MWVNSLNRIHDALSSTKPETQREWRAYQPWRYYTVAVFRRRLRPRRARTAKHDQRDAAGLRHLLHGVGDDDACFTAPNPRSLCYRCYCPADQGRQPGRADRLHRGSRSRWLTRQRR